MAETTCHVRHYPLDLPSGLPFERYEHRPITARDVLVHRIMSKLMTPSPELTSALQSHRDVSKLSSDFTRVLYHNFGPLRRHDAQLARDVQVLRKMLVTRSPSEWIRQEFIKPAKLACGCFTHDSRHCFPPTQVHFPAAAPPATDEPTIEAEILDLITRHFLEADDPAIRLWLQAVQAPRPSSLATRPKVLAKMGTLMRHRQDAQAKEREDAAQDSKTWYDEDIAHLKALQEQTRASGENRLYEGGAFLPSLRKPLTRSKPIRKSFLNYTRGYFPQESSIFATQTEALKLIDEVYPWPEPHAPRRILHIPSWSSWRQKHLHFKKEKPPVNFSSGRTGRGLERQGIWATSRLWQDDMSRGRSIKRGRRRGTSEPPPGLFSSARLPYRFNATRELLIFPSMTISTMERRARRRSLSRTRIAEMFSWDVEVEGHAKAPQGKREDEGGMQPPSRSDVWNLTATSKPSQEPSDYYRAILELAEKYRSLWTRAKRTGSLRDTAAPLSSSSTAVLNISDTAITCSAASNHDGPQITQRATNPCVNCASAAHSTPNCKSPCGYCGALYFRMDALYENLKTLEFHECKFGRHHKNSHLANTCPVAKQNRCKCTAFPQWHVASQCSVLCSRDCGNPHPPGHFKHKNAMGCKSRCCMCGMRGHSGTQCKLRRCRCGGEHLGQDCGFHPECRVKGCDRFLCGVHCQSCGLDRGKLGEGLKFIDQKCPACLSKQNPAEQSDRDSHKFAAARKSKRKNKRKHRPPPGAVNMKEKKPWYAPLEPRTRPIVTSKSGKNEARWARRDAIPVVRIGGCR